VCSSDLRGKKREFLVEVLGKAELNAIIGIMKKEFEED
jgi:hypothetical protein